MADIELVIKIPKYMFEDIQDRYKHPNKGNGINLLEYAVAKGTPLPKGHGRLIDADALDIPVNIHDGFEAMDYIDGEPTIIEADKESEV